MARTNISPKLWGRPAWTFIGSVVESYPDPPTPHDVIWMTDFLVVLAEALPCESCRNNYNAWISARPIETAIESKTKIRLWFQEYKKWQDAPPGTPLIQYTTL